jgi:hypothetical protein
MTPLETDFNEAVPVRRTVRLFRNGHRISLEESDEDSLADLDRVVRTTVDDARHGYRFVERIERFFSPDYWGPNAGLELAARRLLSLKGYRVERSHGPGYPRRLPAPDLTQFPQWPLADDAWIRWIAARDHGIVRYDQSRVDIAWLVAQAILAYSDATFAIVAESKEKRMRLAARLREWIPDVTAVGEYCPERVGRVVLSSFIGLGHSAVEAEKRDIVVVVDAQEGIGQRGQLALGMTDARFRLFGLLPLGWRPSPTQCDLLAAIFGLDELTIPQHGYERRPVGVAWLPIHGGPPHSSQLGIVGLKRQGLWRHAVRNRRIAKIAEAIHRADPAALPRTTPDLAQALCGKEHIGVVVLVETVEHALSLSPRLRDWPIAAGEVVASGLERKQLQIDRDSEARGLHAIATAAGLADLNPGAIDPGAIDVVIWAGGGRSLPPLRPAILRRCETDEPGLLVIDCDDRHHPALRRWTRARKAAYEEAGWFAPDCHPLLGRIDRFLNMRPGRQS